MDATPSPSMAPRTFSPPAVKRSDSGVALGLFSKIAAARKEKLSPFMHAAPVSNDTDILKGRQSSKPSAAAGSQFPEIHDASAHNSAGSRPSIVNSPIRRSGSSRGVSQPLRWTKLEEMRTRSPYVSPPIVAPTLPTARSPAKLATPERPRRSLYEGGRGGILGRERILPLEEMGPRPATAGDEPFFGHVRDPMQSAFNGAANKASFQYQRRASDWSPTPKPSTADASARRTSSSLALRGQPEILVLDSSSKPELVSVDVPEQEIYFTDTNETTGVPVVYRHQKAKANNPERLNLDRRNLNVLPRLEGEQMLRLLNLQNNIIRKIDNLVELPNLIFLDLYNNRIERLENLHHVPNLRVLMLGKNRLQRIENLDSLKKLDVLDLHSNEIESMENLNELTELRVLNLGGNKITTLQGTEKLHLLTELNMRRNNISAISSTIGRLPSLQRLFLSNNRLEKLESLDPLFKIQSIVELRLDNNAVSELDQSEYRSRLISSFPQLKHLDLRPLSDAERKEGLLFYSQSRAAAKERDDLEQSQREQIIAHVRTQWENRARGDRGSISRRGSGGSRRGSGSLALSGAAWGQPRGRIRANQDETEDTEVKPTSREECTVHNSKAGYSEIEVHGEYRVLVLYGDALEVLEDAKIHASVHAIKFQFVLIDRVRAVAASSTSANLKLFSRLRRLNFAHNDIESFDQLAWLTHMGSKVEELFVYHNNVCTRSLFRHFVAARISNVARLNGREVTVEERTSGRQLFHKPVSVPRPKQRDVVNTPPEVSSTRLKDTKSRGVTAPYITNDILAAAYEMEKKHSLLENSWKALLTAIAKETLEEIVEQEDNYMSRCLDGL